jgi:uncharacterized phage infection (PIP) family protein YhgE
MCLIECKYIEEIYYDNCQKVGLTYLCCTFFFTFLRRITDAIREQATGMNSIAVQIEKIAQMAEESSAAADSSADTAKELDRLARETKTIINSYQL